MCVQRGQPGLVGRPRADHQDIGRRSPHAFIRPGRPAHTRPAARSGPGRVKTGKYHFSGATPGYKGKVSVTVVRGSQHGSCSTSFTPHR